MEDRLSSSSSPAPPAEGNTSAERGQDESMLSRIKKDCSSFGVSVQERFKYMKALVVGQAKKATARNEREATAADLMTSKMQVEAADEAENAKKKIEKTM